MPTARESNAPATTSRSSRVHRSLAAAHKAIAERRWRDALETFEVADDAHLLDRSTSMRTATPHGGSAG
jgi:hypothetical protein